MIITTDEDFLSNTVKHIECDGKFKSILDELRNDMGI